MNVIFSRHGNTFSDHEPTVWVGATHDLPLVGSGILQAKCLAHALQKAKQLPTMIYCSPLKRTRDYATILLKQLHSSLKPMIDPRLNEIDYGYWSGLNKSQIQARGEGHALSDWENKSIWPKTAGWSGSPAQMIQEIQAFSHHLVSQHASTDTLVVVTSNGRLRYFLKLIPGLFEQRVEAKTFKVATGNICLFTYTENKWKMEFWNKNPDYLMHYFAH
ncbi:histidine phosphatase family protein [Rickettsiella grylli]|uniref:Phosphoglycerate mutase n=1 Tax=Rickettsiella grylli TaxID=59196 RepID=A8PK94_9COXI|nr:histidine phosphatase family protein [Rickettsiella grylli]EDP46595.1 phosphoglycerate mutase [Rickettsiella grylli]